MSCFRLMDRSLVQSQGNHQLLSCEDGEPKSIHNGGGGLYTPPTPTPTPLDCYQCFYFDHVLLPLNFVHHASAMLLYINSIMFKVECTQRKSLATKVQAHFSLMYHCQHSPLYIFTVLVW